MNAKRVMEVKALIAGAALAACSAPGLAQSGYAPNRDGYGTTTNPYYSGQADPSRSDHRYRVAHAASYRGTVEAVELVNEGGHPSVEKRRHKDETLRINVRMDDGSLRVFTQDVPEMHVGNRVRVESDGRLGLG